MPVCVCVAGLVSQLEELKSGDDLYFQAVGKALLDWVSQPYIGTQLHVGIFTQNSSLEGAMKLKFVSFCSSWRLFQVHSQGSI